MTTFRSYKVQLDPNNKQRTHLLQHAGAARWAYNWGLATWTRLYEEKKLAVAGSNQKIGSVTSCFDLQKRLVVLKKLLLKKVAYLGYMGYPNVPLKKLFEIWNWHSRTPFVD